MNLYKKKYRIESARLVNRDYGKYGIYFVTICTKKRSQWFGEMKNGKMVLSELDKDAQKCLKEIPAHFPNTKVGAFVVMPNHVHAIIELIPCVETQNFASLQNKFGPQSRNLGSVVRGYKIGVKKSAHILKFSDFSWQSRYHDHIVRSENELVTIKKYIARNPVSWDKETIPWHADAQAWNL